MISPDYSDLARGREQPLFALDLQPIGTDIDLQAVGLLLRLVEIVAEHGCRDDQSTDDQKQYVAADRHFFLEPLVDGEKNPARRARGVLRCGAGAPPAHRSDNAV